MERAVAYGPKFLLDAFLFIVALARCVEEEEEEEEFIQNRTRAGARFLTR